MRHLEEWRQSPDLLIEPSGIEIAFVKMPDGSDLGF